MAKKKLKLKLVRRPQSAASAAEDEAAGEADAVAAAAAEQPSSQPDPTVGNLAMATGTGDIELGRVAVAVDSGAVTGSDAASDGEVTRGEATDAAANVSVAARSNRPRGLSLNIDDPNNQAPESADPHLASGRVSPGAGPSAGSIMLPTPTHKSTPTPKHGKGVVSVSGAGDDHRETSSPRKKTPPTDTEDGMASSDEEGGGTKGKSTGADAGADA
eukprot:CAMPEP_0119481214 /NCGR_PEP_ID=MMETSP1344-20130328/9663_1 /TAXON_ID=236787 /ORGANISM="Florenciella parvula, Strain CCMP2471" /LENGTH=215 /DNA_ID=CAMNT_0007515581 /DNA_START=228 /DNA_END=871 /DNA_ORIENTATION=-